MIALAIKANCRRAGPQDPHLESVPRLMGRGRERGDVLIVKTWTIENCFFVALQKKDLVGRLSKMRMLYSYRRGSWGSGPKYLEVYGKLVSAFCVVLLSTEEWKVLQALLAKGEVLWI